MSVSMIPTKRPYDLLEGADVPASPMHLMKRCRYTASSPPSSPPHAGSPSPQHVYRRPHVDSAFVSTVPAEPVERYLPTAKRRRTDGHDAMSPVHQLHDQQHVLAHQAEQHVHAVLQHQQQQHQQPQQQMTEVYFTLDQVRAIVAKAVEEREMQLRSEYDGILQRKLGEQFQNFTKFNEDYINRQMRESPWNYMS
eukprot:Opistho-2@66735